MVCQLYNRVKQNKALICTLYVQISSQYASNMHAKKQLINIEYQGQAHIICIAHLQQLAKD